MDDSAGVGRVERLGQLEHDRRRVALGGTSFLGQHVIKGPALDERHRQIMDAVDLPRVMHGTQVRMAHRRGRTGLPIEAFDQFSVAIVREPGDFRATGRSSWVSSARYTSPMAPRPKHRTIW